MTPSERIYLVSLYVPASHLETVKGAMFAAGAGRYAAYDDCCWQVLGQGQFRPLEGSRPFLGTTGRVERLPEYKLEMICTAAVLEGVLAALAEAHPYEEPAFVVTPVFTTAQAALRAPEE